MIKLTFWQKIRRWITFPLYTNIAVDMCEKHAKEVRAMPITNRRSFWENIMNNPTLDIIFKYEFEKNHKEHFFGDY